MTNINGKLTVEVRDSVPLIMDGTRVIAKVFADAEFAEVLADSYNELHFEEEVEEAETEEVDAPENEEVINSDSAEEVEGEDLEDNKLRGVAQELGMVDE